MKSLRGVLFLHAAVWGVAGLWLAFLPRSVVNLVSPGSTLFVTVTGARTYMLPVQGPSITLARLLGAALLVIAMFKVLVAQKIEAVWWWSWAFVI
ncbi:MAG: hypothetical protein ACJ758_10605, partial [Actinomycetota bacterium]